MIYKLQFVPSALKEWHKSDNTLKQKLKRKLKQRLDNPHVPKDRLSAHTSLYKIKLRTAGYRLVYEVDDKKITVLVLAIGKRNRHEVYKKIFQRQSSEKSYINL